MSIRWDALLARHTARELDALLRGARVRALRLDGGARDLVLLFRDRALLWRLHPTRGHLRMLPPLEPAEGDLALKARVVRVQSLPDDRVLRFGFAPTGSARPPVSLVVELLGNQWNAAVVEGDSERGEPEIVRHVLWRREAGRAPRVGHPYQPPPSLGRKGVDGDMTLEEWGRLLGSLEPGQRAAALVKAVAWTSPLNARVIVGPEDEAEADASLEASHARWRRMAAADATTDPVVLETDTGWQPYPFPLAGTPHRSADSLLAAIEASAPSEADDAGAAAQPSSAEASIGPTLMRRLEGAARRAARREERLEDELAALEAPDALRRICDLILARYHEIPPGAESVRLTGFEGEAHELELDPAEPPHENAARYYARAAKAERARERLPVLLQEARAERTRLDELVAEARGGDLKEEAARDVLGPDLPTTRGQPVGPALPYRAYRSSGGLEIRVGRGSRHNDELTFHHSSPNDVWLHARDAAGAHVVLRWPGPGNPPARDLEEAATLAALHSKSRTSGNAPVDWTLRKYVRKPRKAPPGRVTADRLQTLFVEPDPALPERLERLR
jgi:predicted ribosome quality control (RQC) complex YloA/Tae2 family protein